MVLGLVIAGGAVWGAVVGTSKYRQFVSHKNALEEAARRDGAGRTVAAPLPRRPSAPHPLWPPRRPDDWGMAEANAHARAMAAYHRQCEEMSGIPGLSWRPAPPAPPLQVSWEAAHRELQAKDPHQIRWAQSETGEWVKVLWGNTALGPGPGKPLPVAQIMQHRDTGDWWWITVGTADTVSLDWQRGPQRQEETKGSKMDENGQPPIFLRPCGQAGFQPLPRPQQPKGEHGTSGERSFDDYANRHAPGGQKGGSTQPGSQAGRDALAAALRNRKRT